MWSDATITSFIKRIVELNSKKLYFMYPAVQACIMYNIGPFNLFEYTFIADENEEKCIPSQDA